MKIIVLAKPNAKEEKVEKLSSNSYKISVKEPPIEGRANLAITKALGDYLKINRSSIRLLKGGHSKAKVFEIL